MWAAAVVVIAKGIELKLKLSEGVSWRLHAEKTSDGLMEAFDLAASLGMIWSRVLEEDAQALELELEQDLAAP